MKKIGDFTHTPLKSLPVVIAAYAPFPEDIFFNIKLVYI